MRILVTGGAGFIGSNFVLRARTLRPDWHLRVLDTFGYAANEASLAPVRGEIDVVRGSIADRDLVHDLVADADGVVNFAAESHVDNSLDGPWPFAETNIIGTLALLEAVREHGARLHHVSTDEVYGDLPPGAPPAIETSPLAPSSPYSASKASGDLLVDAWVRSHGVAATISRCGNNYGPRQHVEKFIPRQITNVLTGRRPHLYGSGEHVRDWIHVDDHNDALLEILERAAAGSTYLIGASAEHSNREILGLLLELLDREPDWFDRVQDRPGHDHRYAIDASKLSRDLGWRPLRTDLRAGLAETVAWYEANREWWEPAKAATEARYARWGR